MAPATTWTALALAKLKILKPRVATLNTTTAATPSRFGQGRKRYAPGRDSRRKRVFKRDKFRCRKHFEEMGQLVPLEVHSSDKYAVGYVDHYIPLAQGGADTRS